MQKACVDIDNPCIL